MFLKAVLAMLAANFAVFFGAIHISYYLQQPLLLDLSVGVVFALLLLVIDLPFGNIFVKNDWFSAIRFLNKRNKIGLVHAIFGLVTFGGFFLLKALFLPEISFNTGLWIVLNMNFLSTLIFGFLISWWLEIALVFDLYFNTGYIHNKLRIILFVPGYVIFSFVFSGLTTILFVFVASMVRLIVSIIVILHHKTINAAHLR